ncbi:MAG: hypothetical protein RL171_1541, partial [Pseudomonadota bacterium]
MPPFIATSTLCVITSLCALFATANSFAMGLMIEPSKEHCGIPTTLLPAPPAQAAKRLPDSQVTRG